MGSLEDSFCLKWNDFHTSVASSFAELRREADLFDVTLVCEDKPIKAHKVVISACSAVFKKIIKSSKNAWQPTILLWDIEYEDMEALLSFMYYGEVNVTQDKLNHFLDLAEKLQVKGLTTGEKEKPTNNKRKMNMTLPPLPTVPVPPESVMGPSSSKKTKNNIVEIKEEIRSNDDSNTSSTFTPSVVAEMQAIDSDGNEQFNSYLNDDEDNDGSEDISENNHLLSSIPSALVCVNDSVSFQTNSVEPILGPDGTKEFPCQLCTKKYLTRSRLKRHVLDVHEKGQFPCPDCGKVFTSNRRLKDHQRSRYCHGQVKVLIE